MPEIRADASSLVLLPGHKFHDLLKPARYKIYWGGRGSAKSWAVAEYIVRRMCKESIRVLCTREYQNSVKDSVHKLLHDTINRLGMEAWFDVTAISIKSRAGAEVIFKGLQHDPEGVKGTEALDIVWIEEGQTTSAESWKFIPATVRKPGSEIIVTFNPDSEEAPTYERFCGATPPPRSIIHKVNFDENPYFTEELREEMEWDKARDFHAYEHIWLGLPSKISNAVIFGGKYRVEGFPDDLYKKADRIFLGLDHGFANDPYAFIRLFIIGKKLYIEYEAFGWKVDFAYDDDKKPDKDPRGPLERLMDTVPESRKWPMKADNSRPETISFLTNKGFRCSAADKWKGSVEDGIAHLKGFEAIIIHPRCKHMAQEARLYKFKTDKLTGEILPEIVDANNHGWDAVRYALDKYITRGGKMAVWKKLGEGFVPS